MNLSMLERRRDPRTKAFLPITVRFDSKQDDTPVHLVDLSCSGAALLTTAAHAPYIGQRLEMEFEAPNSDGGTETLIRRELAVVLHVRIAERGVSRVGVRFLNRPELGSGLHGPREILNNHRGGTGFKLPSTNDRWDHLRYKPRTLSYRSPASAGVN